MAIGNKRRSSQSLSKRPLDLPAATVHAFAGTSAPEGWAMCDGSEVSRTDYAALFAAIGTTYGVGDGSTTFNLPDMRGEFLRGLDNMGTAAGARGKDVDGTARTVGQTQANATAVNGLATNTTGSSHSHTVTKGNSAAFNGPYIYRATGTTNTQTTNGAGTHTHGLTGDTETRPANMAINYIIKL
jgi:microcystin-dependent protein